MRLIKPKEMKLLIVFSMILTIATAETCYFIQCTDNPSCPPGFYFSGNFSFEGCGLVPRYLRFQCCEEETYQPSNAFRINYNIFNILLTLFLKITVELLLKIR